jgi:glutathione S-transferase
LKTSSANQAQGTGFLPIFKNLLQEAGQVDVAFAAQKEESDERKSIEKWIDASTNGQDVPVKELDEHLKNKTYIAGGKLTAADVAVFGALNNYIARSYIVIKLHKIGVLTQLSPYCVYRLKHRTTLVYRTQT